MRLAAEQLTHHPCGICRACEAAVVVPSVLVVERCHHLVGTCRYYALWRMPMLPGRNVSSASTNMMYSPSASATP